MNQKLFKSKYLAIFTLFTFILFFCSDIFPQRSVVSVRDFDSLIKRGKELYENGEYTRALSVFIEAFNAAKTNSELSEVYFDLSLAYYATALSQKTQEFLEKLFKIQPSKTINEQNYPSGFIELFNRIKTEEKPIIKSKPIAQKKVKKKGGGGALIILGILAAAGGVAALALGGKGNGGGGGDTPVPTVGSIQVNSTPSGARVFLNGNDTGVIFHTKF